MRTPFKLSIEFRVIVLAVLCIIGPYGLLLYFFPAQNPTYWTWDMIETRSAMLVGGVYIAATFYYILVLRENEWLQGANGLGALIVFSIVLLVATALDWDRFKPYHLTTFVWLMLYYAGPLLFPIIFRWQNERAGPQALEGKMIAPAWRNVMVGRGFFYFAISVLGLIVAAPLSAAWPWPMQPLEFRVFMGQVAIIGWIGVVLLRDVPLLRYHRLGFIAGAAIGFVQLVGLFINRSPYNWGSLLGVLLPLMLVEWIVTPLVIIYLHRK